MATLNDELKNAIDASFQSQLRDSGVHTDFNISSVLSTPITSPLTLFVSTTGNDSNNGRTEEQAFRTIQAALDSLQNREIRSIVTINVGAGTFDGFYVGGLTFTYAESPATDSPGLKIVGTKGTPVLTTGTTSGTITSTTNANLESVDSNQNWTVNELTGKFVEFTSSTGALTHYPIRSNTATALALTGTNAGFNQPYTIYTPATFIRSNKVTPGSSSAAAASSSGVVLGPINGLRNLSVKIQTMEFNDTVNGNRLVNTVSSEAKVEFKGCHFNYALTTQVSAVTVDGFMQLSGCKFSTVYTSSGVAALSTNITVVSTNLALSGIWAKNTTVNGTFFAPYAGRIASTYGVVENYAIGIYVTLGTNNPNPPLSYIIGHAFLNCTTILSSGRPLAWFSFSTPSGTYLPSSGNTNGVVVSKGTLCQIPSTFTGFGASTELSVDGATETLANMRLNTPKTFPTVANIYGTLIYE